MAIGGIYVALPESARTALIQLSDEQWRSVRDQATLLIIGRSADARP